MITEDEGTYNRDHVSSNCQLVLSGMQQRSNTGHLLSDLVDLKSTHKSYHIVIIINY